MGLGKTIFLTSYMRPELTQIAIERIVSWSGLKKLVVIVDGLRPGATEAEEMWRKQVLQVVDSQQENAKLELWVYDKNIGITEHQIRIQKRALEIEEYGLWLEEDMEVDLDSYSSFSIEQMANPSLPFLFSGYSEFNHDANMRQRFKSSLFLPVWGLTMNAKLIELVEVSWKNKIYNPEVVKNVLRRVFASKSLLSRIHAGSVERFWTEYISWGFRNPNRWDALALYALWCNESFVYSPLNRLVRDISYSDPRGMNKRGQPINPKSHSLNEVRSLEHIFCEDCEIVGSRILKGIIPRITNSFVYRLKNSQ